MKSKIFLILLAFFLVKVSAGQEICKPDIVKFKSKSITTIDSDEKLSTPGSITTKETSLNKAH